MARSCSARGCAARDNGRSRRRGISFHQFPADAVQRLEWIRAVNRVDPRSRRPWWPGPGAILCSRHFAEADFETYGLRRKLRRGAVPSRFLSPEPPAARRRRRCRGPVAAGDHNYSVEGRRTPLETRQRRELLPEAGRRSPPALRPRTVASLLRELVEKQQLPEETLNLLQAQFSGRECNNQSS